MGDFVTAFALGTQFSVGLFVFAAATAVSVGRWVTGDDDAIGFGLRAAALVALFVIVARLFGTLWYWLLLPGPLLLTADLWWGEGLTVLWLRRQRQHRVGEAMAAVAQQPRNPIQRVVLGRTLLENGDVDLGLAELGHAEQLADEGSREVVARMATEAREEYVRFCPRCQRPNRVAAKVCRACYTAFSEDALLRGVVAACRPVLRRLRTSHE